METTRTCKLDVDRFRQGVVEKLATLVGGKVEDTGHHLRIAGGQYDAAEVELTFRRFGHAQAVSVDGKQVRQMYAENSTNV
jgi:hypothetical protein